MITFKELLSGNTLADIPLGHQLALEKLFAALNKFRIIYGKPMNVTSGYRTMQHHLEIYSRKGITDRTKIPMNSKHLSGKACDFADPSSALYAYCLENINVLESCGLWIEAGTVGWVHFQCEPPASGKRVFIP